MPIAGTKEHPERVEIGAWSENINTTQRGVEWHFQTADACTKLKKLDPKIQGG